MKRVALSLIIIAAALMAAGLIACAFEANSSSGVGPVLVFGATPFVLIGFTVAAVYRFRETIRIRK